MAQEPIDIDNIQLVGMAGDLITVLMPRQRMTKQEALVHAAWLVALADETGEEFEKILRRVEST